VKRLLLLAALAICPPALHALSADAEEFMAISKALEGVQCEKRKLRREIVLAEAEQRDAKDLRARFARIDGDPKTARLEKRLGALEPRLRKSSDADDLPAISRQQREAFYRCE
jgi:hypothetical protein